MEESTRSASPKVEVIIVGVFFLIFTFWAFKKCSNTRTQFIEKEQREKQYKAEQDSINRMLQAKRRQDSLSAQGASASRQPSSGESLSRLYVTIAGLKMRKSPELNAEVIEELPLFDEVFYLNEVTAFTQEINLGKAIANEPWVKIQTRRGRAGWVFGAGVNYYKKKNPNAD